jgi:UDP-N-acetyl-2-amino-2-deoxyglucuronate dehydrogenase
MTLRLGFIGFGRVVKWHISMLPASSSIQFVVDIDPVKRQIALKDYPDTKVYDSVSSLISSKFSHSDIDYVIIATPSGLHFEHAMLLLSSTNWDICIEKPTFLSPLHFSEASNYQHRIYPIFQNRFNSSVLQAKTLLAENELGKPVSASLSVDWSRPQRYYDLADWRGTFSGDGGVSTNQGIHYFDICRLLLGDMITCSCVMKRLLVDIECEDYLSAFMTIGPNSIPLDVRMTTSIRHHHEDASLTVNCQKGSFRLFGVCCNNIQVFDSNGNTQTFNYPVEMAYGYGHREFFKILLEPRAKRLELINIHDSLQTMKYIYSCYYSSLSGSKCTFASDFTSVPLGRDATLTTPLSFHE